MCAVRIENRDQMRMPHFARHAGFADEHFAAERIALQFGPEHFDCIGRRIRVRRAGRTSAVNPCPLSFAHAAEQPPTSESRRFDARCTAGSVRPSRNGGQGVRLCHVPAVGSYAATAGKGPHGLHRVSTAV